MIHGPNIPGSYAILLFAAWDFTSITSHIHNWVLFLLWLHPFILSGVISPLISSSILGTYQPGEFIFQCPVFLPFHAVCGVLKARILKWFAIPFSSGPHFVRTVHQDPSVLGGPIQHGSWPHGRARLKQEMADGNVNILGISAPKCTGMGEFNSGDHYIYCYGQESLRRNGVALIVNKESKMHYLSTKSKMTE